MNRWSRGSAPPFNASHAASMSLRTERDSPVTEHVLTVSAICLTASKSPFDEAGKPASMMSTRSRSS